MFLKAFALGALLSTFSLTSFASAEGHNCLTIHLRDAVNLNEARKPLYQALSQGKSTEISDRLLLLERRLLSVSPLIDLMARPYQKAGVPVLCEEFIDMSETPEFQALNPDGKDSHFKYQRLQISPIKKELKRLFKKRDYAALANYADRQVITLEQTPRYHCMVRHVLESIRRMALLVPKHNELSLSRGLAPSESLSRSVLNSHIGLLNSSEELDYKAAPLQADGIQIICQDVPHIPTP